MRLMLLGAHRHSSKVWHLARNETECGKVQQALIHSNATGQACSQVGEIEIDRERGE